MLADGADHHAARLALARGWELVIPLPFGKALNAAINGGAANPADARAIFAGEPAADPEVTERVDTISALARQARLFEMADDDQRLQDLFLDMLERPGDTQALGSFAAEAGKRSALAGRILIEQSDIVIAVWDGKSVANIGGTGHTALIALEMGSPVLWIDPAQPAEWQILLSPEALTGVHREGAGGSADLPRTARGDALARLVTDAVALAPPEVGGGFAGLAAIGTDSWRSASSIRGHAFRRVEALFGETGLARRFRSVRQTYERPDEIAGGSGQPLLGAIASLPQGDPGLSRALETEILRRFAWLDGISSYLSDHYRSGMIVNFLLGAMAIIAGILYLPLVDAEHKWIFAALELALLLTIVVNTASGQRARLHGRWFETRRAAEYLRHSPLLAALGAARPPGAWPQGTDNWWPEWYVRHALRRIGLPQMRVDKPYLRALLEVLRDHHVDPQRHYHRAKSARLARVHHRIDLLSETLFLAAVLLVAMFLALAGLSALDLVDPRLVAGSAKWFTVLAVALPTLGGAFAGIRYFGDFERFAEISEVTAEKLDRVSQRIALILDAPHEAVDYSFAADIVHAADEIVFAEIQNWQAVFSGKRTAVPA
ncbi:hypothetical protein [Allopontixanthobacter sp.]|uniref:hypothetical protein n=1 Tax=Allopontixanthobacter sp. TaxID=2906452 RepID=UPI002AB9B602|nr:hypothetical protein [Allopontixanthobacter sp.]MDZ4308108.1 hypothetical protein [Allopontixanthobacter sp.]